MKKILWLGALGLVAAQLCYANAESSPVLLMGDSMMRLPGMAVERELLRRRPDVDVHVFSGIGTGLARLDAFDWLGKIKELTVKHKPVLAIVSLGANDRQPMRLTSTGATVQPGTEEWIKAYAARIEQAADLFIEHGCKQVVWLLLPPMRDPIVNQHAETVNALVKAMAAQRPQVSLFDVGPLVADRRSGGYTERIIDPKTASAILVRERDGIHLSPLGARRLATALVEQYWGAND